MADPRQSPPSIRVQDHNNHSHLSHRSSSRTSSYSSGAARPFSRSAGPMSIPGGKVESAPPPLPPPRYIEDLAVGRDPGWAWGNSEMKGFGGRGQGAVSPGSSLRGGGISQWDNKVTESERRGERMVGKRRDSSTSTIRSPPDTDMYEFGKDEGYHSLSGSSLAYQLHGERPLEQQNRKDSSHAYDKQLLSKIGKPKTPPRAGTVASSEGSPVSQHSQVPGGKPPNLKSLSLSDRSFSTSSGSPFKVGSPYSSKWINSPPAVVSPGLISSAVSAKSFLDYRSPTLESSAEPFPSHESEPFSRRGQTVRRSDSNGSILSSGLRSLDEAGSAGRNVGSRFNRVGSFDQGIFTHEADFDTDPDFPMDDSHSGMRQLHLDDRSPQQSNADMYSPRTLTHSRSQGLKRKASHDDSLKEGQKAPPVTGGGAGGDRGNSGPGSGSDLYQRRISGHHLSANRASPVRHHPSHASISSASSAGIANSSYASSTGLSVGASSITSISSQDRLSPSGISPLSEHHDDRGEPYVGYSLSLDPSLRGLPSSFGQHRITAENQSPAAIARKMSSENPGRSKPNGTKLRADVHICECCPKKPKKFDTIEELRHHQSEKQYFCHYCNNRFKNKNEAERHQNSLHLRRHSWSCATLDHNYEAAFHPSTALPPHTNPNIPPSANPASYAQFDICGYCGAEFPNNPAPDWVARSQHLTNVHKFGECNQSKKFFRADHFRQHLKHSHAGTSGKWTNMLENACMKDEPPLTPEAQGQEQLRMAHQQQLAQQLQHGAQNQGLAIQASQQLQQQAQQAQQQSQMQGGGAPVVNMMGGPSGLRQGPYPAFPAAPPGSNELQYQRIDEELKEEMQ